MFDIEMKIFNLIPITNFQVLNLKHPMIRTIQPSLYIGLFFFLVQCVEQTINLEL